VEEEKQIDEVLSFQVQSVGELESFLTQTKLHKKVHAVISLDNSTSFSFFGWWKSLTTASLKKQAIILLQMPSLQKCRMSYRRGGLGDEGIKIIASGLVGLYNLEALSMNLDQNNISDEGIAYLMKNISALKALSKLHLIL
jgi:hypothetical protein